MSDGGGGSRVEGQGGNWHGGIREAPLLDEFARCAAAISLAHTNKSTTK